VSQLQLAMLEWDHPEILKSQLVRVPWMEARCLFLAVLLRLTLEEAPPLLRVLASLRAVTLLCQLETA
jgi:hypothetical protein